MNVLVNGPWMQCRNTQDSKGGCMQAAFLDAKKGHKTYVVESTVLEHAFQHSWFHSRHFLNESREILCESTVLSMNTMVTWPVSTRWNKWSRLRANLIHSTEVDRRNRRLIWIICAGSGTKFHGHFALLRLTILFRKILNGWRLHFICHQ